MSQINLIALDPGGTTGWATARYTAKIPEITVWERGQIVLDQHHQALWELLGYFRPDVIICESFEYRNRSRPGLVLDSCEYIGIAKLYSRLKSRPIIMQTASMGKGFVSDDNIKACGLWSSGNVHAMDATRHLLYYMINELEEPAIRKQLLKKGWK